MDESYKQYVEQKNPDTKKHTARFHSQEVQQQENKPMKVHRRGYLGVGRGRQRVLTGKEHEGTFQVTGNVLHLNLGGVHE